LGKAKAANARLALLRRAQASYPLDFWINIHLALSIDRTESSDNKFNTLEALGFLRAALVLQPQNPAVHAELGFLLDKLNRHQDAEAAYRQALALRPANDYKARYNLGLILEGHRKYAEAIPIYRAIAELDPPLSLLGHNRLAWVLISAEDTRLRDPKQALWHAQKAVALHPDSMELMNTLGAAYYRNVDTLSKVAQLRKTTYWDTYFLLALAHWRAGNKENARAWLDKGSQWFKLAESQIDDSGKRFIQILITEAHELMGVEAPMLTNSAQEHLKK
jgi:Flp pilus assembly protein TadD